MEASELMLLHQTSLTVLLGSLLIAIAFEAVNGFHDTANAVATVIYTNSLSPRIAVALSGVWNFLGVYLGGTGVAFAIVHLLPMDLLVDVGSKASTAMIFAILISALAWNVATWYKGIPASSSHTLIGAIIGVGFTNALVRGEPFFRNTNLANVDAVFLSLLLSPIIGFTLAAGVFLLFRKLSRNNRLFEPPWDKKPPRWIRTLLIITSSGVSFAHGSNDGQKGVGLVMIILIAYLPAHFALNLDYARKNWDRSTQSLSQMGTIIQNKKSEIPDQNNFRGSEMSEQDGSLSTRLLDRMNQELEKILWVLDKRNTTAYISPEERLQLRKSILLLEDHTKTLEGSDSSNLSEAERIIVNSARAELRKMTDYAPPWVMLMVALSIGLGTMIGWKRVVVTVGERIGSRPLTYAQGASSEMVAMLTISLADVLGLPVSTTHVLSSGVAGTMVANRVTLQHSTVREIALAWVLTLPVTTLLGGTLFLVFGLLGT
jgi:inorganic phosphate transporter, PiT family